jgi:hypothetical protein
MGVKASLEGRRKMKERMGEKDWSYIKISIELGDDPSDRTIRKFVNGEKDGISIENAIKISKYFGFNLNDIIDNEEWNIPLRINEIWQGLCKITAYTNEKMGLSLHPDYNQTGWRKIVSNGWRKLNLFSKTAAQRYLKQVQIEQKVRLNICTETEGYLFLLEKDSLGSVFFAIDPISVEQRKTEIIIPDNENYFTASTVGKCELWAAVIPKEKIHIFDYLKENYCHSCENQQEQQPVNPRHLQQILDFVEENSKIETLRTHYLVVK